MTREDISEPDRATMKVGDYYKKKEDVKQSSSQGREKVGSTMRRISTLT